MTVCISAVYRNDDKSVGMVLITDRQITDTQTSFKSHGQKAAPITPYVGIMGAGDMTYFGELVVRTASKIDREKATVTEVVNAYWEAEVDWQNEYREHHVLGKYNLTWKSYFEKLEKDQLPEAYLTQVNDDLKALQMPCSADAIIGGINPQNDSAQIVKIENGVKDGMSREGFAVIGEGNTVALSEFGNADYNRYWTRSRTVLLAYVAKKRSEQIASVGDRSTILIIDAKFQIRDLPIKYGNRLDGLWQGLEKGRKIYEGVAYESSKEIFKEYDDDQKAARATITWDTKSA